MKKEEVRKAIIDMGNGDPDSPESWIELTVENLDWALDKLEDADYENTGVKDNLTKEEREAIDEVGRLEPLDDWMERTKDADHENDGVKKNGD